MNTNSDKNWQERIEEIEAEIYDATPLNPPNNAQGSVIPIIKGWFSALPSGGKVIITVFGVMLLFSLISTVFSILKSLLSILVIGVVFYIAYKFVNSNGKE
ncbi:hypothetical protein Cyast_1252 [Cyanobacterium stanieri PCC 7202]|uniref:Uncharacterized protein n=1 Tax=Cyanobacterium stanieri (strain ATCC 29140 / PCC 7202) TaxID=292563 RepID=K9YL82_CYASC|nr:hypothetical protein Cyast_1252 [Cyanobacterium stanieri PCC 7202]